VWVRYVWLAANAERFGFPSRSTSRKLREKVGQDVLVSRRGKENPETCQRRGIESPDTCQIVGLQSASVEL
jgi:hypothetical protein